MHFEWDREKARASALKHGVTFRQAMTVFEDDRAFGAEDFRHSTKAERRYRVIGLLEGAHNNLVVVIYTMRGLDTVRIISARPGTAEERTSYEED